MASIVPGDLVAYACSLPVGPQGQPGPANDDIVAWGGGINIKFQVIFGDIPPDAPDDLEVISTAAEIGTLTITARQASGVIEVSTGLVPSTSIQNIVFPVGGDVIERVLSIQMSDDAVGVVTVRRRGDVGDIHAIPIGERGCIRLFRGTASEAGGTVRYDKFFWRNNNITNALIGAAIDEIADASATQQFALATTFGDTETTADRKTAPTGGLTFNSNSKNVPGSGDLSVATAIGVWVQMTLAGGQAPIADADDVFTSELRGTTA